MGKNMKIIISLTFVLLMILVIDLNSNDVKIDIDNNPSLLDETLEEKLIAEITENTDIEITEEAVAKIESHGYYITSTITENEEEYTSDYVTYNNRFTPFYKKQIQHNYNKGLTIAPKYIVIHETANTAVGANANAHYRYWNRDPEAYASTHFVVDSNEIYQMLELNQSAWHVGDNKNHSDITNLNSIGIEVAVNADGDFSKARQNAIDLTINLMKALNMDITQLKRHYDASGKYCPTNMLQNPELWQDFVNQVANGLNED